ncbi:MAG TPA: penicillin-binding protein 1C [Burkholderiales bacterium]|nr:penicillin-binding protein 1C [Burkholderiales bacterium]
MFVTSLLVAPYEVTDFASVRTVWRASDAWLVDRHGEPLSRVRIDHERRRGDWVAVAEVSPALTAHVLASEDRRFREHAGVDWRAIPAAVRATLTGGRRGASTLTMQLASYLHPELERSGRRSVIDKWRQMRQALAIERRWGKDEILEAWLNLTPFRGELEGIDAAARSLFGKRAAGLDRIEAAVLTALVRAPNASASRVARRACALLRDEENGCLAAQGLAAAGLRPRTFDPDLDGAAPHLARKLLERAGDRVASTLDAPLQRFAVATLTRHLRELEGRNVEDGAVLVLDNATGETLAYVGSSGTLSQAREVDGVTSPRQAGSTLKPFLYALALERTLLTAASILDDSPLAVTLPTGLYVPQNYDHTFKGRISLRQALASSLNVPAVRTVALIGYEPFHRKLKTLGLELPRDAEHYGYALALGGADVTLLQLANAYRTLANAGRFTPTLTLRRQGGGDNPPSPSTGKGGDGGVTAVDARAAFVVSDILADASARALTFGFASPLATRYRASVKTGTSKDMRDNWAVGYTSRYTVGVWVGNFSGEAMHDVSGIDGAAPVWRAIMDYLHEGAAPPAPPVPDGIVRQRVTFTGALDTARDEWFLEGTAHARVSAIAVSTVKPRIETPPHGAIYAIDPDIPRDRQRLTVTASGAPRGARLVLEDGRRVRAERPLLWLPAPGKRVLVLEDAAGRELDRVRFEVRGVVPRRSGFAAARE